MSVVPLFWAVEILCWWFRRRCICYCRVRLEFYQCLYRLCQSTKWRDDGCSDCWQRHRRLRHIDLSHDNTSEPKHTFHSDRVDTSWLFWQWASSSYIKTVHRVEEKEETTGTTPYDVMATAVERCEWDHRDIGTGVRRLCRCPVSPASSIRASASMPLWRAVVISLIDGMVCYLLGVW